MHIERAGDGSPTIVLIHGSMAPGWETWSAQKELASDFSLVVPHRIGYPPNPARASVDPEEEAAELAPLIEPGAHLVGHSYGGLVALHMAAMAEDRLASLTVIEPSAFDLVRGHPAVEESISAVSPILADRTQSVRDFMVRFLDAVGSSEPLPDPLPPEMEASARARLAERLDWEVKIPLDALRRAEIPVLVVSGGHSPALDAACDALERELHAERAVITGADHEVQSLGEPFNRRLREFISAAERGSWRRDRSGRKERRFPEAFSP